MSPTDNTQAGRRPLASVADQRSQPWRVFLSHTSEFRDYPDKANSYVAKAERAVSAAGHSIVYMADFAAEDQPPAQVCEQKVQGCDVYIGVIGFRYGSPVRDRPEVSYTELEFETATALGHPRLLFLLDGQYPLPTNATKDTKYGQRQEDFRQRLCDAGLTVQMFTSPDHLGQLVERSLRQLAANMGKAALFAPKPAPERRQVFISYTRVDRQWVDRLQQMMKPLLRAGGQQIVLWDNSQIEPGALWREPIETALSKAKVALLLVSDAFLASEFVMNEEVPKLLAAAEAEGVRVLWVSLSPCLVEHTPIGEYQAVLPLDHYLDELDKPQQQLALETIVHRILEALSEQGPNVDSVVAPQPMKLTGDQSTPPESPSIIRWRIQCRVWREPLGEAVDLPMVRIPADASKKLGEYLLSSEPVLLSQWLLVASWPEMELKLESDLTEHGQPNQPVTGINVAQALEFCRRLAVRTGRYYELPSEDQWEHACRAGSAGPYSWGESWSSTLATATANPWGLRKMHGSVWQWCRGEVLRGGSWNEPFERRQANSRASAKDPLHPSSVGLRLCCLPFGTPYFQLEASKSQWRPIITRAACTQVLARPLNESEFIQLEQVLQRFRILGILQLRLFLSLLADRLGDGIDDLEHPLALDSDHDRLSSKPPSVSTELYTLAASAWRKRGWYRLADQAKAPQEVLAELGLASGKRQEALRQALDRSVTAFPEPL